MFWLMFLVSFLVGLLNGYVSLSGEGKIIFGQYAPEANTVYLAGTFNSWSPNSTPMKKVDDRFEIDLSLPPGTYYYKFIIDGRWIEDIDNPAKVDDGFGGFNSVFTLTADNRILMEVPRTKKGEISELVDRGGQRLYLAIVWHQHQPMYLKDPKIEEYTEPWVRLHGIKDYYDMAAMVRNYPSLHLTINLTPVLLMQLEEIIKNYEKGLPTDKYVRLSLKDASSLTDEEKDFLILSFFSASWSNMIDIYPRYRELRLKRVWAHNGIDLERSRANFTEQDYRDLQCWFNLAWFDPDFKEGEVNLPTGKKVSVKRFIEKGRNFTELDKKEIIDAQFEILRSIVPVHNELVKAGKIELTTTPFFHPILPLIYDNYLTSEPLPSKHFQFPEDAKAHIQLAIEKFISLFGIRPYGMWPAEGSVSKEVIPLFADAGIKWIATDEKVLARTLGKGFVSPEEKYMPYVASFEGKSVIIVFRDTELSDAIGFKYSKMHHKDAAFDFISRLYDQYINFKDDTVPHLVVVILDGENAWENYPRDGKDFLHELYSGITGCSWLKTVKVYEFIQKFQPQHILENNLYPGSWINASFATWIGENEENIAWDALYDIRKAVQAKGISDEKVMLEIYALEGSDWFWWYGKDQESAGGDSNWDLMFRERIKNLYNMIGVEPPSYISSSFLAIDSAPQLSSGGVMAESEKVNWFFTMNDKSGDDYGPGAYKYPTDPAFKPYKDIFDLRTYKVGETETEIVFKLYFGLITDPWNAPLGFSMPIINIYLSTDQALPRSTKTLFQGANVRFDKSYPWNYFLKIAGFPEYGQHLYTPDGKKWNVRVTCNRVENSVTVYVPKSIIGEHRGKKWAHYVLIGSQDGYGPDNFRDVTPTAGQWTLGGNEIGELAPRIVDMLDPAYTGETQRDMLSSVDPEINQLATVKPVIVEGK